MPLIITGDPGTKNLNIYDPNPDSKVGRWCYEIGREPDIVPDLCDSCWDPETLAHYPAEGYRLDVAGKHYTRLGVCNRCAGRWQAEGAKVVMFGKGH